jgi:hypothetical protein
MRMSMRMLMSLRFGSRRNRYFTNTIVPTACSAPTRRT